MRHVQLPIWPWIREDSPDRRRYRFSMATPEDEPKESALQICEGVTRDNLGAVGINRNWIPPRRALPDAEGLFEALRRGDRVQLARAITLIESLRPEHQSVARDLLRRCLPYTGNSVRIGITGVPGVGKSTFIESFGLHLCDGSHTIAVLTIDPSSDRSRGSILGDKTRMEQLSQRKEVFIRPSPSAGSLGGVARRTREAMLLCEAAGFDVILVETVGVGQSEIAVRGMVDFFLLLMLAGAGDELQGIKRGIMEMADAIAITKSDGDNVHKAKMARQQYQNALHLFPPGSDGWLPPVLVTSAVQSQGIDDVWHKVREFESRLKAGGSWNRRRREQLRSWMRESILAQLESGFYEHEEVERRYHGLEQKVLAGKESPFQAAEDLVQLFLREASEDPAASKTRKRTTPE